MTTETYNIVGDVAGQYKTLIRLLGQMPTADKTILVGDLVDRGPNSRKVVQFAKTNQDKVITLMGNHEHMFCDFVLSGRPGSGPYDAQDWLVNGGGATVRSYLPNASTIKKEVTYPAIQDAMLKDAEFLSKLPTSYMTPDGLIVTHAPLSISPEEVSEANELSIDFIWYRGKPKKYPGWFQVHGHNSTKKPHWYRDPGDIAVAGEDAEPFGINIDTSRAGILTGIHWPSKELFQQEYID